MTRTSMIPVWMWTIPTAIHCEPAWPDTPRWMDIADQSYSTEFQESLL